VIVLLTRIHLNGHTIGLADSGIYVRRRETRPTEQLEISSGNLMTFDILTFFKRYHLKSSIVVSVPICNSSITNSIDHYFEQSV